MGKLDVLEDESNLGGGLDCLDLDLLLGDVLHEGPSPKIDGGAPRINFLMLDG